MLIDYGTKPVTYMCTSFLFEFCFQNFAVSGSSDQISSEEELSQDKSWSQISTWSDLANSIAVAFQVSSDLK